MTELRHELWLAHRLAQHGAHVLAGDTTPELRRDRMRESILKHGLDCVVAGRHNGRPETYAQVFERLYGEKISAAPKPRTQDSP